jgi:hypothetical protein
VWRWAGGLETFNGLTGLGDLVLTCTGELSRNREVGVRLAQGKALDTILSDLGHVAEGVLSARAARRSRARARRRDAHHGCGVRRALRGPAGHGGGAAAAYARSSAGVKKKIPASSEK